MFNGFFLPCDGWFRFANASTFECDFGTILRLPDDRSLRKRRFDKVFRHGRFVACFISSFVNYTLNLIVRTKFCSCIFDEIFKMFSFSIVYLLIEHISFRVNRGMYKKIDMIIE